MKVGIYENLSQKDYHASKGISRSQLNLFGDMAYKFWYKYLSGQHQEDTDTESLVLGSLVHTLVLEPDLFEIDYAVSPEFNKRTTKGREDFEAFTRFSGQKTVITEQILAQAQKMAQALSQNEFLAKIIPDARIENSIYWIDKDSDLLCKSRPDVWKGSIVADVKTVREINAYTFQREAMQYGYFLQAGMIAEALEAHGHEIDVFAFVCVEKKPPFASALFVLDDEAVDYGRMKFHELIDRLKNCLDGNEWPSYEVHTLSVPNYCK